MAKKKEIKKVVKLICPESDQVSQLTDAQCRILLSDLMTKLDELSMDDFFGTEGWRHYLGYED